MLRHFVWELSQKAHTNSMREDAKKLLHENADDKELIEFLRLVASSYYCSCNYCEEKTAASIVLREIFRGSHDKKGV